VKPSVHPELLNSYFSLRDRVDRFAASVRARYRELIQCKVGCSSCCQAGLTLTMIEAVVLGEALDVSEENIHLQAGQSPLSENGSCALLTEDRACSAYLARPLVCRTHGLALRYSDRSDIVHCELNFVQSPPHISSVLDMDNLETALFAVNLEYCRKLGINPLSRVAIDRIGALCALREKK
jgi:Fe-S-cluster containining protein